MTRFKSILLLVIMGVLAAMMLSGCGYNTLQKRDEQVKEAWSNMMSIYQKRADLIPNLVQVVQGYASHEKGVLTAVTNARASVGSVKLPEGASAEELKKFEEKQREFSSSLSRLLVVAENYPQLKADQNFLDLQRQLVNIENQIVVMRKKYTREVRDFNVTVRSFPTNLTAMFFGHKEKPQLAVDDEVKVRTVPQVKL